MSRIATGAAIVLMLASAPLGAQSVKPKAGVAPTAGMTDEQVIDCLFRMVKLSNAANRVTDDETAAAERRKTAATLEGQASRGVALYMGILYTMPWVDDRKDQTARIYGLQSAEPVDVNKERTAACLARSLDAAGYIFNAAMGKMNPAS